MDIDDENAYLALWESVLQAPIGPDDDLVAAGVDSLRGTALLTRIAEEYSVELELWDLLDGGTPRRVQEIVREKSGHADTGSDRIAR